MNVPPRVAGLLALTALVPAGIYAVETGQTDAISLALTGANVVLITVLLFLVFGPASADHADGSGAAH